MTATERQERTAARRAARAAQLEQERKDQQLVCEAMRSILSHPDSTPAEMIFALEILENLNHYSFSPYESFTKTQIDEAAEERRRAFREEFAAHHPEIMKEIEDAKKRA